jgi:dolichol-phosphate mannosyltransferase
VRGIRLRRNFGKASALAVGADAATGPIIVTMDADLQDDPAEIPRFLDALAGGADLVSGWKVDRQDPLSKRLPSKLFNRITSLVSGVHLRDHNCGFKAGRREIYTRVPLYGELHRYIPAMAHGLGYEVAEIEVHHRARKHGRSKFGVERYLRGLLDLFTVLVITRYGRRPGHFFGGIGIVAALVGFLILSYLTGVWLLTDDPIGNRPLLTLGVLLEVVAVQLIAVGILAELILHRTGPRPESQDLVIDQLGGRRAP